MRIPDHLRGHRKPLSTQFKTLYRPVGMPEDVWATLDSLAKEASADEEKSISAQEILRRIVYSDKEKDIQVKFREGKLVSAIIEVLKNLGVELK